MQFLSLGLGRRQQRPQQRRGRRRRIAISALLLGIIMLSLFHRTATSEIDQRSSLPLLRSPEPKSSFTALDRKVSPMAAATFSNEDEKKISSQRGGTSDVDSRIKQLEREVVRVKDSESNMLESLMSQTKQLEETKIELEEAKLEIKSLKETIGELDDPTCNSLEAHLERVASTDLVDAQQKIARMKTEVKLAIEAEEKSKKAMDDLASALQEVALEAHQAKEKLSLAQSEVLEKSARADTAEEKLRLSLGEVERLKMDAEESTSAWDTKQEGFRECMTLFEEEITRGKKENERLFESEKTSKEETSKMRDIMKQALNEATVVKEALEIARNENYELKDSVDERDRALLEMERDYEALKLSETAALAQVEGLKHLLTSSEHKKIHRCSSESSLPDIPKPPPAKGKHVKQHSCMSVRGESEEEEEVFLSPTEISRGEGSRRESWDKNSLSRSGSLKHQSGEKHSAGGRHRRSGSFSSFSSKKVSHSPGGDDDDDGFSVHSAGFGVDHDDYADEHNLSGMNSAHKKKPMFRKFTDILRRKKVHVW